MHALALVSRDAAEHSKCNARHYLVVEGLVVAAILFITLTFTLIGVFSVLKRRYLAYLVPHR